jgi:hypothetical protein
MVSARVSRTMVVIAGIPSGPMTASVARCMLPAVMPSRPTST